MKWTKYQVFLAILLVCTGSINTITLKLADTMKSVGRDDREKYFLHPFFQACTMFLGEVMCLIVYKILYAIYSRQEDGKEDEYQLTKGNREFNVFILFIPAICDMVGACCSFLAMNLTYAASFQMLRGSSIVFVGLLSITFLDRTLLLLEWLGIFFVILGLVIVGVADFLTKVKSELYDKTNIIIGDVLIVFGESIRAIQMVVEEKFVQGKNIPCLQAVGWEGVFGFVTMVVLQIILYFIRANPPLTQNEGDRVEDALDAFVQIGNNNLLCTVVVVNIISIAFFNFAGISVTKEMSATTRMVLDTIRTIVIWMCSLLFFGQVFHWLQVVGLVVLIFGMCLYNGITCQSCRSAIYTKCCGGQEMDEANPNETNPQAVN